MQKIDQTTSLTWALRVGAFFMSIAIMVSSWFLNQAWSKIAKIEDSVRQLEISSATTNSNRFTAADWNNAKTNIDIERLAMDRRVMRLEENSTVIKDSLGRIEATMTEHFKKP